jgi:ATP-binding protein involved in chromosome partitioning
MVTKYMRLFIEQVEWGELDVLLLDLPPGTGDTQLSLAQAIPLSGAVIITTPQEVSLNIARRGLRMFEKVQVPILGLIENMAGLGCPACGVVTHVFKEHGAAKLANQTHIRLLGSIPLDPRIVEAGDAGIPVSIQHPSAASTKAFALATDALCDALEHATGPVLAGFTWQWQSGEGAPNWDSTTSTDLAGNARMPVAMRKKDPRTLQIRWQDGAVLDYDVRDLRLACPCAHCVDEVSRLRTLDPETVPCDIEPRRLSAVGRYAVTVSWTDGHSTGIYSYDRLRGSGEHAAQQRFEV